MHTYIYIYIYIVDGKVFVPDIRAVHVRDLNFVLRSKIFVHWDGQLRASYLVKLFSPSHPRLKVSDDTFERHPKSSSEDDLQWHPLASLSEAWGKDFLGRLCSDL